MKLSQSSAVAALLAAALLADCSGHGGSLPATPAQTQSHQTAAVKFSIKIPQSTQSGMRRSQYISSATSSASVSVQQGTAQPSTTTITCAGGSCSGTVTAPIGSDTFSVQLLDSNSNVLSKGQTTATILAGQANTVSITFGGVIQSVVISVPAGAFTTGVSSSLGVLVAAKDADNYTIVGPQPYDTPIALTLSDGSGTTSLSAAQVKSPEDPVQLNYNGGPGFTGATISATVGSGNVSVTPATVGADGSGTVTSLQGYMHVALVGDGTGDSGLPPFKGMSTGPDGRLWVSFEGNIQSGLYAVDVKTGTATFYQTGNVTPGAVGLVNGYVATIDENHNFGGLGDLVLYNADGTLYKTYAGPQSGGTSGGNTGSSKIFQANDGKVYVMAGPNVTVLDPATGSWASHAPSDNGVSCNSVDSNWTTGSDGNFYNMCDLTDFVRFTISTQSFTKVAVSSNQAADQLQTEPVLGSDGNLYAIHALTDTTTSTYQGLFVGVSAGTGGPATATYQYAWGLTLPIATLASAKGQIVFYTQDSNVNYNSVLDIFDQSSHTFSEYGIPGAQSSGYDKSTTIRDSGGNPIGIAFVESGNAIGMYVP